MRICRGKLVWSLALLALGAAQARAEGDYARSGAYLGLAQSLAVDHFSNTGGFSYDPSYGVNTRVGYRGHPHFSVELEGEWLSGFDGSIPGGGDFDLEAWAITTNLKVYPWTGRLQPFLLAGVGIMEAQAKPRPANPDFGVGTDASDEERDLATRFGAGVEYYLTEHFVLAAHLTYLVPFGGLDDFVYLSIGWGAQYRF
ncbi:MAG: porin family protein [Myxococcota bacterium]